MKKIMTLCLAVGLMAGLAVNASAADYEFSTGDSTEYYGTTVNNVNAWVSRARSKLLQDPALQGVLL